MKKLNTNIRKYLFIILGCLILSSCLNENVNTLETDTQLEDAIIITDTTMITESISKYSIEEQQKVYGEINFGISKREYYRIMPNKTNTIGKFKYDFIPSFNDKGVLYELNIIGKKRSFKQYVSEVKDVFDDDSEKTYLNKLIQEKYGKADKVSSPNRLEDAIYPSLQHERSKTNNLSRNSIEYDMYKWDISNKVIQVSLEVIDGRVIDEESTSNSILRTLFVDFTNPKTKIYAAMKITDRAMKHEVDSIHNSINRDKIKENADRF